VNDIRTAYEGGQRHPIGALSADVQLARLRPDTGKIFGLWPLRNKEGPGSPAKMPAEF
jgi:hypothetical protein